MSNVLRWAGSVGIITIAVMRCQIAFAPQVVFDIDPAIDPGTFGGFGPAGSLWLDVLLFALCGIALLGEVLSGRRVELTHLMLACIPFPIAIWHGAHDGGDMWRGMTWCAAALAGVTIAHLARDVRLRGIMIALLIAVVAPLIIRGIANVTYEYDHTVEIFEQNREAIFAEKGWAPDSSSAKIYERRLRHREPTGWFLTTNVFGSFMAFGLVALAGLAIDACRTRAARQLGAILIAVVFGCAVMLVLTGSMGAQGSALIGLLLLITPLVSERIRELFSRFAHAIGGVCIALTLLAVLVRGTLLPESFLGEKSLLFRWYYQVASSGMFADHWWAGVGPDGYAAAYTQYRLPRNPEEVASAHNVYLDWLCTLGASAVAWVALTLLMIRRAGVRLREVDSQDVQASNSSLNIRSLMCFAAAGVAAAGAAVLVERIDPFTVDYAARMIGLFVFLAVAMVVHRALPMLDQQVLNWSLATAGTLLLVHCQIELTFTQPGAAVWVFCALGVAAPAREGSCRWPGWIASMGSLAMALWTLTAGALPALRQQSLMIEAKDVIVASIDQPREAQLKARVRAAELLEQADLAWPIDEIVLIASAEQYDRAGQLAQDDGRIELLLRALAALEAALADERPDRAEIIAFYVDLQLAGMTRDVRYENDALAIAQRLAASDPNGLTAWRRLGDLLWDMHRRDEARDAYEKALEANENFALDPLKQLPEDAHREIERRLAELREDEIR